MYLWFIILWLVPTEIYISIKHSSTTLSSFMIKSMVQIKYIIKIHILAIRLRMFRYRHFHALIRNYMHTRMWRNKCHIVNPPLCHFIEDVGGVRAVNHTASSNLHRRDALSDGGVEVCYCYYVSDTIGYVVFFHFGCRLLMLTVLMLKYLWKLTDNEAVRLNFSHCYLEEVSS